MLLRRDSTQSVDLVGQRRARQVAVHLAVPRRAAARRTPSVDHHDGETLVGQPLRHEIGAAARHDALGVRPAVRIEDDRQRRPGHVVARVQHGRGQLPLAQRAPTAAAARVPVPRARSRVGGRRPIVRGRLRPSDADDDREQPRHRPRSRATPRLVGQPVDRAVPADAVDMRLGRLVGGDDEDAVFVLTAHRPHLQAVRRHLLVVEQQRIAVRRRRRRSP